MLKNFTVYNLAKAFHWKCRGLRMHRVHSEQIFRATSSIVLNIAEGSGKGSMEDQRRFYRNSLGSLRESQAILELEKVSDPETLKLCDDLGAILYTLSQKPKSPKPPDGLQTPEVRSLQAAYSVRRTVAVAAEKRKA